MNMKLDITMTDTGFAWSDSSAFGTITRHDGYTLITDQMGGEMHLLGCGYGKAIEWLEKGNRPQRKEVAA